MLKALFDVEATLFSGFSFREYGEVMSKPYTEECSNRNSCAWYNY